MRAGGAGLRRAGFLFWMLQGLRSSAWAPGLRAGAAYTSVRFSVWRQTYVAGSERCGRTRVSATQPH